MFTPICLSELISFSSQWYISLIMDLQTTQHRLMMISHKNHRFCKAPFYIFYHMTTCWIKLCDGYDLIFEINVINRITSYFPQCCTWIKEQKGRIDKGKTQAFNIPCMEYRTKIGLKNSGMDSMNKDQCLAARGSWSRWCCKYDKYILRVCIEIKVKSCTHRKTFMIST